MTTIDILIIVFTSIVVYGICGGIGYSLAMKKYPDGDGFVAAMTAIFWPIMLPGFIGTMIVESWNDDED